MRRIPIHKGDSSNTRNAKKRFNNELSRKNKSFTTSIRRINTKRKGKFHGIKKVPIRFDKEIERFCNVNNRFANQSSRLIVKLDNDFTFFNNPSKVLLSLLNLLTHAKSMQTYPKITYNGYVSFGAIYLIDNLCWEIGKKRKWLVDFAKFPDDEKAILANLRSAVSSNIDDDNKFMVNERILINRNDDSGSNQRYRTKATEITEMIEKSFKKSLKDDNYQLPLEIHGAIKSAIGEQFDNIFLHATDTSHGTLCSFFNKNTEEITILIYNFGKTIAETLTSDNLPDDMWNKISELIKNHNRKKLWNFTKGTEFTLENALTLFALQEGISSRIKEDITRGHGLIDFISNCFDLSIDTRVAIVSGKTAIKIDKKYPIGNQFVFGRNRQVIALNDKHNIFDKPDPNYITSTGVAFNGVIIETTIPLKVQNNGNC